jgi:hypothetical protein
MIIIKLMGGLGNQMFQYATAKNLALKHNTELYLDISWYSSLSKATPRSFELQNFLISGELPGQHLKNQLLLYNNRVFKYFPFPRKLKIINEKFFQYDSSFESLDENIYLNGYWQSYKYFDDSRLTMLTEFTPNDKISINQDLQRSIISNPLSVAMHIRRTDYLSNPNYPVCSIEYYQKAIDKIQESICNPTFYIFSDDPVYVFQKIKFDSKSIYIEQGKDTHSAVEDLRLMSFCSNQIIANSSFSWWGAWLNTNPTKIVIAPSIWFSDKNINTQSLCPPNWIRL